MARRRASTGDEVSLFPFLSVITCVIGIVIMLIVFNTLSQSQQARGGRTEEEIERARSFQDMMRKQQSDKATLEKLQELIAKAQEVIKEHEDLEKRVIELRRLLASAADLKKQNTDISRKLQRELEDLLSQLEAMAKEKSEAEANIKKLLAELEARKKKPDEKPPAVVVNPEGSSLAKDYFIHVIEAVAGGIIVHKSSTESQRFSAGSIGTDADFNTYLEGVAGRSNALILFLVRDDAVVAYNRAAGWAESKFSIRTSQLPLPGKGELDLSVFTRLGLLPKGAAPANSQPR
jgi:hypothetical protein